MDVGRHCPGSEARGCGARPIAIHLGECLVFLDEENAQNEQSTHLPCGKMNRNIGHRCDCFPDLELLRHENSRRGSLCAERHVCPGQAFNFQLSTLDCELLVLTMSTHAAPMFTLTDSASRPKISALDRAGRLEMQTHQECPPRRLTRLECTLTKNGLLSSLECTDTNSLDLKFHGITLFQKKGGGGAYFHSGLNDCLP